ncbi:hypothetical protein [Polaribacter sp. Asnod6-C07]|uniref:hypothetical protein n=1 Tax=Polaribacter sp. Asnod6-C07 TaxID=3160582 RepID=UPI0038709274
MKFKIIFFVLYFFCLNVVFSQTQGRKITFRQDTDSEKAIFNKLDIEQAKYRAKYKIKEITHFKIQNNQQLESSDNKQVQCRHSFNKKGRLISIKFYQTDSDTTNFFYRKSSYKIGQLRSFSKFEYDTKDNLIKEKNYAGDGSLIKTIEKKKPLQFKKKLKLDSLKITYYSSLLDQIRYYSFIKNKFKRDKSKRIKTWIANSKSNHQKIKYFYFYDEVGFTRKEIHYNTLNKISYSIIKNYNNKGFETKSKRYLKHNIIDTITETEYKYYQ